MTEIKSLLLNGEPLEVVVKHLRRSRHFLQISNKSLVEQRNVYLVQNNQKTVANIEEMMAENDREIEIIDQILKSVEEEAI
jgi:hypothetical protein